MLFSAAVDATVLFIGTDYVFDGTSPPYNEEDDTNPLNDYGLSKLEGEKIVLSVNNSELLVVYYTLCRKKVSHTHGRNFVTS